MGRWSFRGKAANLAAPGLLLALLGAAPTGGVYVTTLPAGADVWVDGTYLGHSPIVLDAVGVGAHRLTLTRTGWASQDVTVTVVPAAMVTTSVVLTRGDARQPDGGGSIAIHGDKVAAVAIDGEPATLGKDGTYAVSAGTHDLTMTLPQGKVTRTVTVYPQTRTDVAMLGDTQVRSVVIAPADEYVAADAVKVDGGEITIHTLRHDVVAHIGSVTYLVDRRTMTFDTAPAVIKNRVYLPIELLSLLNASDPK